MKFSYYNDTRSDVNIHPATETHGTVCDMSAIKPFEQRDFELPEGTFPWVKQWENGTILVSPTRVDKSDNDKPKHMGKYPIEFSFTNESTGEKLLEFCNGLLKQQDIEHEIVSMFVIIRDQVQRHLSK